MKCIILKGGLGNQLFQLAKFIDLNHSYFKDIKFDVYSGFLLDYKYRRKLEIKTIKKRNLVTTNVQSFFNLFLLVISKKFPNFLRFFNINVIDDASLIELADLKGKNVIFNGYFQNYNMVNCNINKIYNVVKPHFVVKKTSNFKSLIDKIDSNKNSVALGIRFYEESKNPLIHAAANSNIKSVENFNKIIKIFEENLDNPIFFIFVQNENNFTRNLVFRSQYQFVSHANGFLGSWERLTAQSHCKHHIFNNSTFYYWGAIFSRFININPEIKSEIYISDNFIFDQIYNPNWKKF